MNHFTLNNCKGKSNNNVTNEGFSFFAAVVLTIAVLLVMPKFVDLFFYDPRQSSLQVNQDSYIMNRQINNELTTQNHFLSKYEIRSLGFGSYEVTEVYQNLDQNHSTIQTVTIDKITC